MPSEQEIRAKTAAAAARLLAELLNPPPAGPVQVEIGVTDGTFCVRIEVAAAQAGRSAGGNGLAGRQVAAGPHLTKLDHAILEAAAAAGTWQTKLELASACDDHDLDSYFCGRVRRLKGLGLLLTDRKGRYRQA